MGRGGVRLAITALWATLLAYWVVTARQPASPRLLIPLLWLSWIFYWALSARRVKRTRWREPPAAAAIDIVPLILAFFLLAAPHGLAGPLGHRFLPRTSLIPWLGTLL